jgi:Gpi18-like mannosyltransferase
MFSAEKKLISKMVEKKDLLFFLTVTVLGLAIRYTGRNFVSGDMQLYLTPWFHTIQDGGRMLALKKQVGNYSLLYQTVIALLSYSKANCVFLYKAFSILFDYILAIVAANSLRQFTQRNWSTFNLAYAVVLFLPTVVLNSSFWGQCDSIYTAFAILFLTNLYQGRYTRGFVCFGIAFAFKFQTIFLLPFAVSYYFYKKKFSIFMFAVSIAVFWVTGIAAFIAGRGLFDPFLIYMRQANTYPKMWLNVPSFWQILGNDYGFLSKFAVLFTLSICGIGFYLILSGKKELETAESFFNSACWFVWVCILFLPAMHERYTFLLDILLLILSFISAKYLKYAVISVLFSTMTYGVYLFEMPGIGRWHTLVFLAAFAHYSYTIYSQRMEPAVPQTEVAKKAKAGHEGASLK